MRNYSKFFLFSALFVLMSILVSCNDSQQITESATLDGGDSFYDAKKGDCGGNEAAMTSDEGGEPPSSIYGAFGFTFNWEFEDYGGFINPWFFYLSSDGTNGLKIGWRDELHIMYHSFEVYHTNSNNLNFTWLLDGNIISSGTGVSTVEFATTGPGIKKLELLVNGNGPCDRYRFWVEIDMHDVSGS